MKVYTTAVLEAIAECLRTIYWYMKDLRSFLVRAGVPDNLLNALPWDGYKRTVASELIDRLARNPSVPI